MKNKSIVSQTTLRSDAQESIKPTSSQGEKAPDWEQICELILHFRDERDWRQFHGLRHLMISLQLEAGEVLELAQWKSDEEVEALPSHPETKEVLADELADVLSYLVLLADRAGIDLLEATARKLKKNAVKYPADLVRGSRQKYTLLKNDPTS